MRAEQGREKFALRILKMRKPAGACDMCVLAVMTTAAARFDITIMRARHSLAKSFHIMTKRLFTFIFISVLSARFAQTQNVQNL